MPPSLGYVRDGPASLDQKGYPRPLGRGDLFSPIPGRKRLPDLVGIR